MAKQIPVTTRASQIEYAIRDVVVPATALEAKGHNILKLNIGDPLAYPGLPTPTHMIDAYQKAIIDQKNGYSPAYGIESLRNAIAEDERSKINGGWNCSPNDVYICHGVTEALQIIFAAYLSDGDEVLAPGPHYPPYMAYPQVYGGKTVEYRLDPENGWSIDMEDLKSKMNDKVKLLVLINPNNPTGNVISEDELDSIIDLVSNYENCTIISDEIYDRLNFNGDHFSTASRSQDVPVITLNGVSKVYYAPGWRIGYMAFHDPKNNSIDVKDGIERLLRSRLCASTPAQYGYLAGLQGEDSWMNTYLAKIKKSNDYCIDRINNINGLSVQPPQGAFYMFVKLTDPYWYENDKKFVLELLHKEQVLTVHGSGFSKKYGKGHFRIVFLPTQEILKDALDRIENFLSNNHN
ncbi:MAG: aminotransferase class I/II-fold pyridoxal phosphate-dependent enzyme [Candidatus Neomarinimicrobiota bacterium]